MKPWNDILKSVFTQEPKEKQKKLLIAMGLLGILLLIIPSWLPGTKSASAKSQTGVSANEKQEDSWAEEQAYRLEMLISRMEGAGEAKVMITLETKEETVYATDSRRDSNSDQESHVLLSGASEGLVETVWMPQVQGVAVLCQGADSPAVQSKITEMVSVLMGISANRISIAKLS